MGASAANSLAVQNMGLLLPFKRSARELGLNLDPGQPAGLSAGRRVERLWPGNSPRCLPTVGARCRDNTCCNSPLRTPAGCSSAQGAVDLHGRSQRCQVGSSCPHGPQASNFSYSFFSLFQKIRMRVKCSLQNVDLKRRLLPF